MSILQIYLTLILAVILQVNCNRIQMDDFRMTSMEITTKNRFVFSDWGLSDSLENATATFDINLTSKNYVNPV
jgi:hypothetical protein